MHARLNIGMLLVAFGLAAALVACSGDDEPETEQTATPLGATPQVDGRLMSFIIAEFGSEPNAEILCEYDALVTVEGKTVIEIVDHGDRPEVDVGDEVAESLDRPDRPGVEPRETGSSGGQIHYYVNVYWDERDELQVGCAPESQRTESGGAPPPSPWGTPPFP